MHLPSMHRWKFVTLVLSQIVSFSAFAMDKVVEPKSCVVIHRILHLDETIHALRAASPRDLVSKYFYQDSAPLKAVEIEAGKSFAYLPDSARTQKSTDRLKIEEVMKDFNLSRIEAVEVQALLRSHTSQPNDDQLLSAMKSVLKGDTLSKLNHKKIADAPFTLVFDFDGTLGDQDTPDFTRGVHEKTFLIDGRKTHHVSLNKAAVNLLKWGKKQGAAIVIYSRNSDHLINPIAAAMKIDGVPLIDMVDGILTSSHMVLPESLAGQVGTSELSRLLKKDMRLFPTDRAVIVDDNPDYILQKSRMAAVPEYTVKEMLKLKDIKSSSKDKDRKADKKDDEKDSPSFYDDSYPAFEDDGYFSSSAFGKKTPQKLVLDKEAQREVEYEQAQAYEMIQDQIEVLMQNPKTFREKQVVFSPLGDQATLLLMGEDRKMELPDHQKMSASKAQDLLLNDPAQVMEILKKAVAKKVKPPSTSWFSKSQ